MCSYMPTIENVHEYAKTTRIACGYRIPSLIPRPIPSFSINAYVEMIWEPADKVVIICSTDFEVDLDFCCYI